MRPLKCRGGGTGRRAGLKIRWWRHRVGSIPTLGTNRLNDQIQSLTTKKDPIFKHLSKNTLSAKK